jgi:uncharacterized protein (UPF0297 family)
MKKTSFRPASRNPDSVGRRGNGARQFVVRLERDEMLSMLNRMLRHYRTMIRRAEDMANAIKQLDRELKEKG